MDLVTAVEEYLSSLRSERGLASNTLAAYRRDLDQYLRFLGTRSINEVGAVTADDIAAFQAWGHAEGWASSTSGRKLAAVRGLHRFTVAEGDAPGDPTVVVESPRRGLALPKALTVDDVEALLESPDRRTPLGSRDAAMMEILYATGARITEAVTLRPDDIDPGTKTALVTGKGSKQRVVPLGRLALDAVAAYLPLRLELKGDAPDPGRLFLNSRGGPLTRQGGFLILKKHAAAAGIDPTRVSPHVLRHSAATHMVEGGADLRTVQEILGHASISTTQVYTRVSPRHLYEVFMTSHPRSR